MLRFLKAFLNSRFVTFPTPFLSISKNTCSRVLGLDARNSLRFSALLMTWLRTFSTGLPFFIFTYKHADYFSSWFPWWCCDPGTPRGQGGTLHQLGCFDLPIDPHTIDWTFAIQWFSVLHWYITTVSGHRSSGTDFQRTPGWLSWTFHERWTCFGIVPYIWRHPDRRRTSLW